MANDTDQKIKLLIVDDHILMRMGLASALDREPDLEVVAEAENGQEALDAFEKHSPDVVIMDLRMPRKGGLETIKRLKDNAKNVRALVYSNYASGDEIYKAFKAGARGFVVKDMPLETLLQAIRTIAEGKNYIPPEISLSISSRISSNLTRREMDVLHGIAEGLSNKEIGAKLNLVESTVKVHMTNILSKLGVSDRTQAILTAIRQGIIEI